MHEDSVVWQDADLILGGSQNSQGWDASDPERPSMVTPGRHTNIFNVYSNLKEAGKHQSRGHASHAEADCYTEGYEVLA